MEQENLDQNFKKRPQVKVRSSRDAKWLIFRIEGIEQPIILAANYLRAILESADKKRMDMPVNAEKIKN